MQSVQKLIRCKVHSTPSLFFLFAALCYTTCLSFVERPVKVASVVNRNSFSRSFFAMSVDSLMVETYEMLSNQVLSAIKGTNTEDQYWICLAGGPGAGKSTLSAAVVKRLNELSGIPDFSVVLPMDGFHFSRKQLREISEQPDAPTFEELLARRGSQWTFDANAVCAALSEARKLKSGKIWLCFIDEL